MADEDVGLTVGELVLVLLELPQDARVIIDDFDNEEVFSVVLTVGHGDGPGWALISVSADGHTVERVAEVAARRREEADRRKREQAERIAKLREEEAERLRSFPSPFN